MTASLNVHLPHGSASIKGPRDARAKALSKAGCTHAMLPRPRASGAPPRRPAGLCGAPRAAFVLHLPMLHAQPVVFDARLQRRRAGRSRCRGGLRSRWARSGRSVTSRSTTWAEATLDLRPERTRGSSAATRSSTCLLTTAGAAQGHVSRVAYPEAGGGG